MVQFLLAYLLLPMVVVSLQLEIALVVVVVVAVAPLLVAWVLVRAVIAFVLLAVLVA